MRIPLTHTVPTGLMLTGLVLALAVWLAAPRAGSRDVLAGAAPGISQARTHGVLPDMLPGPVPARALRTVDGDTLYVRADVWVGQTVEVAVRVRGIDAPELHGRCAREKALARRAQAWLAAAADEGPVALRQISGGKYFGRVIADIITADGRAVGPGLVAAGLARPYDGGHRQGWCGGQ